MTDAEFEAQRARLQALIEKWPRAIGLGRWIITYAYSREPLVPTHPNANWRVAMATDVDAWEYSRGKIDFDMPMVADLDDDDLEQSFVHELCHLLLAPIHDGFRRGLHAKIMERVVDDTAQALIWAYELGHSHGLRDQSVRALREAG